MDQIYINITGSATVNVQNYMRTKVHSEHSYLSFYMSNRDGAEIKLGDAFCCDEGFDVTHVLQNFNSLSVLFSID